METIGVCIVLGGLFVVGFIEGRRLSAGGENPSIGEKLSSVYRSLSSRFAKSHGETVDPQPMWTFTYILSDTQQDAVKFEVNFEELQHLVNVDNQLTWIGKKEGGPIAATIDRAWIKLANTVKAEKSADRKAGMTYSSRIQTLKEVHEMMTARWRERADGMTGFLEKHPHIRERLERDQRWLMMTVNVDAFWNEFRKTADASDVQGVEAFLDANPMRHKTELRRKADLAMESSSLARKHLTDVARDVHDRSAVPSSKVRVDALGNCLGEQGLGEEGGDEEGREGWFEESIKYRVQEITRRNARFGLADSWSWQAKLS